MVNLAEGHILRFVVLILLSLFSNILAKTYLLKNSDTYNGASDMWVYRKETEVVTSGSNTFHINYEASLGDEDTLHIQNDIYRQS